MKFEIKQHALERALERGANQEEIKDVLVNGFDIPAKGDRKGRAKVYSFNKKRLNTVYEQKRIEVIYTVESDNIIAITVYVFYGKWKEQQ
jgi:hypothetical protein